MEAVGSVGGSVTESEIPRDPQTGATEETTTETEQVAGVIETVVGGQRLTRSLHKNKVRRLLLNNLLIGRRIFLRRKTPSPLLLILIPLPCGTKGLNVRSSYLNL